MRDVLSELQQLLNDRKIDFKLIHHEPILTSEEAAKARGSKLESGAKALIVKADNGYYMFVLSAAKKLDSKKAKTILDSKNLRFATEDELMEIVSCKPGAIPPFGKLFGLQMFVDKSLLSQKIINFNAGRNDTSIEIRLKDYLEIVEPIIDDFSN